MWSSRIAGRGVPRGRPHRPPGPVKRALASIALSKPGSRFFMDYASRFDPWLVRTTRGRLDSGLGAAPILIMTAPGARSGEPRTVPLVYFTEGSDVILMASSFGRPRHPAWYHNARAAGEVELYRRGVRGRFTVTETQGAERDRLFGLARQLYRGYGVYEERVAGGRTIPCCGSPRPSRAAPRPADP